MPDNDAGLGAARRPDLNGPAVAIRTSEIFADILKPQTVQASHDHRERG